MIERYERKRGKSRMRGMDVALLFSVALVSLFASCTTTPKTVPISEPLPVPETVPEPPKPNLADLIAADDQGGIKTFFASQDQLNTPDAQGGYPLHRAIEKGSAKTVELLLLLGA